MHQDFRKFATKHMGINSLVLDDVVAAQNQYLNPYILEERQLNVTQMDVFSRLMMDRIIFLGTAIDDYTANTLHSRVMIHQPLGGAQGQASDIEITAREIMKLKKELYTIISEHSHTEFDKVWADSDRDYWMTASEAKEYGMVDRILSRKG